MYYRRICLISVLFCILYSGAGSGQVVVNTGSMLIHKADCNHLPDMHLRKEYPDSASAEKEGYRKCPICFPDKLPDLKQLTLERKLGLEAAAQVRYYYNIEELDKRQEIIKKAGQKALEAWPNPLKGYVYRFYIIDSRTINAISCPGDNFYHKRTDGCAGK